jgi:hypothetical protein
MFATQLVARRRVTGRKSRCINTVVDQVDLALADTAARVGHIAAEFERLANVLLRRGCGNPALMTYPLPPDRLSQLWPPNNRCGRQISINKREKFQ